MRNTPIIVEMIPGQVINTTYGHLFDTLTEHLTRFPRSEGMTITMHNGINRIPYTNRRMLDALRSALAYIAPYEQDDFTKDPIVDTEA